jgi:putative transposase
MRVNQLLSKSRKKKKQVFPSGHEHVVAPNLIQRHFRADKPNQKWFTDVSYLPFGNQMLYFSSIIDGFNNEVISFRISTKQDIHLALGTLEDACKKWNPKGTILHSDQGGIYTSKRFQLAAKEKAIITSMSRKGNCHDNASIESFHSQLKTEGFYSQNISSTSNEIVLEIVRDYIHYYNHKRIQEKLGYLSPVEYRQQTAS